eukprot:6192926-Pleurochrysis_carterae.AAC.2
MCDCSWREKDAPSLRSRCSSSTPVLSRELASSRGHFAHFGCGSVWRCVVLLESSCSPPVTAEAWRGNGVIGRDGVVGKVPVCVIALSGDAGALVVDRTRVASSTAFCGCLGFQNALCHLEPWRVSPRRLAWKGEWDSQRTQQARGQRAIRPVASPPAPWP